jgi:hypothetical protein
MMILDHKIGNHSKPPCFDAFVPFDVHSMAQFFLIFKIKGVNFKIETFGLIHGRMILADALGRGFVLSCRANAAQATGKRGCEAQQVRSRRRSKL